MDPYSFINTLSICVQKTSILKTWVDYVTVNPQCKHRVKSRNGTTGHWWIDTKNIDTKMTCSSGNNKVNDIYYIFLEKLNETKDFSHVLQAWSNLWREDNDDMFSFEDNPTERYSMGNPQKQGAGPKSRATGRLWSGWIMWWLGGGGGSQPSGIILTNVNIIIRKDVQAQLTIVVESPNFK